MDKRTVGYKLYEKAALELDDPAHRTPEHALLAAICCAIGDGRKPAKRVAAAPLPFQGEDLARVFGLKPGPNHQGALTAAIRRTGMTRDDLDLLQDFVEGGGLSWYKEKGITFTTGTMIRRLPDFLEMARKQADGEPNNALREMIR